MDPVPYDRPQCLRAQQHARRLGVRDRQTWRSATPDERIQAADAEHSLYLEKYLARCHKMMLPDGAAGAG
jgi:hypothetical protein